MKTSLFQSGSEKNWLALFLSVFVFVMGAGASTIRDDRLDSDYLNLAGAPEYASAGRFVNSWGFSGSAILIAPDWILTAGHLFTAASSGNFTINGKSYGTSQLIDHPSWNNDEFHGYDFGLAQLGEPVAGGSYVPLYSGSSEFGEVGTFVGFGAGGTGLTGQQFPPDNLKRAFQNMIDGDFGTPSVLLGADFDNPGSAADSDFGSPIPLDYEGCVANGDSGGGVFITVDSVTYLAGVISFVAARDGSANSDYGDVSGFGRVSAVLPWINSIVPEPTTGSLAIMGIVTLLIFRIRAKA